MKTGRINIDALRRDRDQIFAEAVARFKDGERWWPDKDFEQEHIEPEQANRYEADPWEEAIRAFIRNSCTAVLVGEIAREALHIETNRIDRAEQNRITAILKQIGWERRKKDSKGNIPWGPPLAEEE